MRDYQRLYRVANKERIRKQKHAHRLAVRAEGIAYYGARCACCGELEPMFLTMEHRHGRTRGDRATGLQAWVKAKAQGWPNDIELLCFNCNCARGAFGECPHQRKE